jgi:hypothetical protein
MNFILYLYSLLISISLAWGKLLMERVLSFKQGDILPLTSDLTKADAPVGRSYFTFGVRRSLRTDIQRFPVTGWFEMMVYYRFW